MVVSLKARGRILQVVCVLLAVVSTCALTLGCTSNEEVPGATSAMGDTLAVAQSAITSGVPDAKLLAVQTMRAVSTTSTIEWMYLFGSESECYTYTVFMQGDRAVCADYSPIAMTKEEWAAVPSLDTVAVDSDEAYARALAEFADGKSAAPYRIELLTYRPEDATPTVDAMVWFVIFNPAGTASEGSTTYEVNALTGEVALAD